MSKFHASSKTAEKLIKKYSDHVAPEDTSAAPEYDASTFGDFQTYFAHKKQKVQNRNALLRQHAQDATPTPIPQIFRGVVAWVNGYTNPSAQDLTEMIVVRGGVMLQYLEGKTAVTHVIASKLTPKKEVEWARYKVVRPEWVVECVREGKLLPWERWRTVGGQVRQGRLGFGKVGEGGGLSVEKGMRGVSYKEQALERARRESTGFGTPGTPVTPVTQVGRLRGVGVGVGSSSRSREYERPRRGKVEEGEGEDMEDMIMVRPRPKNEVLIRPSSSAGYIPPGKNFAVVIPRRSKTDGPENVPPPSKRAKVLPQEEVVEDVFRNVSIPKRAKTSTPRLTNKLSIPPAPIPPTPNLEEDAAYLFPSYQLPPLPPSSPPVSGEIPPSHQPLRNDFEIPESSPPPVPSSSQQILPTIKEVNRAKDEYDDDVFNMPSFSKSEGDAVEDLMKGIFESTNRGNERREIPPSSQMEEDLLLTQDDEIGGAREMVSPTDIPPSTQPPPSTQKRRREEISSSATPNLEVSQSYSAPPLASTEGKKTAIKEEKHSLPPHIPTAPTSSTTSADATHTLPPPAKRQKVHTGGGHDETANLLANPRIRNSTVLNPGFLKQYYQESRLHHLSTWKANLKQHLQVLVLTVPTPSQSSHQPVPPRRYIFHIDFDCFFAAVSILYHPNPASLEGKPVCVTHATGASGDVASCNYTARARGVKNGMWLGQAKELCPEIICLPYEFEKYEEISRAFYGILIDVAKRKMGVVVQSVSVDEAVMDVTPLCYNPSATGSSMDIIKAEQDIADSLASSIRSTVKETTRCDVSIGISSNPLLARLALRRAKPSGQVQLRPGNETREFLDPLRVQDLPSVGSSTAGKLAANGVTNIGQLRELSLPKLKDIVGDKTGEKLYNYARGIDDTPVTGAGGAETSERKSVSADVNWGVRFETQEQAEDFLLNLAGEVKRRLEEQGVKGRKLTLKVMKRAAGAPIVTPKFLGSGKCDTLCKSANVGEDGRATWDPEILGKEAVKILRGFGIDPKELRGLGMQMTKLEKVVGGGAVAGGDREKGQKVLQFKPVEEKSLDIPNGMSKRQFEKSPMMPPPPPPPPKSPVRKQKPVEQTTPSHPPPSTQFIVPSPSQIDHSVLDALPSPIRRSILEAAASSKPTVDAKPKTVPPAPPPVKQPPPPKPHFPPPLVPSRNNYKENNKPVHEPPTPISASQIDPEFLASLTPSLREEILSEYRAASKARAAALQPLPPPPPAQTSAVATVTCLQPALTSIQPAFARGSSASPGKRKEKQTLLPNSPRKNNLLKRPISPPKRRGAHGGSSYASGSNTGGVVLFPAAQHGGGNGNTTTTNRPSSRGDPFKSHPKQKTLPTLPPPGVPLSPTTILSLLPENHNLDPETLSVLPRDILDEVIADARRRANLKTSSSSSSSSLGKHNYHGGGHGNNHQLQGPGIRCLRLPTLPRPLKKNLPQFQKLRDVEKIVELLGEWYASLTCEEEEGGVMDGEGEGDGPNVEDVQVLVKYLGEVVCVERDMSKARRVVRGFAGVVLDDEGDGDAEEGAVGDSQKRVRRIRRREEWVEVLRTVVRGLWEACRRRGVPEMETGVEREIGL